jgi:hypothetical protein
MPYHDSRAWGLFLKVGKDLKPALISIIGDFADFYAVSSHSKNPKRANRLDEELDIVRGGLDDLDALGADEKIFVEGNHEDRLRRYMQDKAPELHSVVNVEKILGLKERGWQYVPYKDHTRVGKLYLTHDVGVFGRYSVYRALDTYQHSVITGHSHRFSYVVEGNAVGEHKVSAAFGWLGDSSKIDYMHRPTVRKNWALGFGYGYLNPTTGIVYVVPVPIIKYTCVVNGKLYTA